MGHCTHKIMRVEEGKVDECEFVPASLFGAMVAAEYP
jgi:hypothetical protein